MVRELPEKSSKMNPFKYFVFLLGIVFCISLISAVPQVIFTDLNMTISNGTYHLWGEGIDATDSFATSYDNSTNSCYSSYERFKIPMTFSREFEYNDTDIGVLLNSLALNNNMSLKWEECIDRLRVLNVNYTMCRTDVGYKANYTACNNQLINCNNLRSTCDQNLQKKEEELKQALQWRNILFFAALAAGFFAYNNYQKIKVKQAKTAMDQLPSGQRFN